MVENLDPWYNTKRNSSEELTYLSIALLGACNMNCIFCYVDGDRSGMWQPEEIIKIFDEAKGLGMQKVQLSGGEPLLYPHLERILSHLSDLDVDILMATNATRIIPEIARLLAEHKVNVGVSFETIDERVSDELAGRPGLHQRRLKGIETLKAAGYTCSPELPLNIIIKTLRQNFPTYMDTWKWAKDQGIQPILDRAIPGERCKAEWVVTPNQLRYLFDEIGKMEGVYHRIPFLNNEGCNRINCGVHVEVDGAVYPCAGVPVSMGNVKERSLTEIWLTSDFAQACRDFKERISGSCKTCEESDICSGCRGVAYAVTGDVFGSDPLCWNYNHDK